MRGDVETPEQASAQELRRRFDPYPDKKLALISEIKKGANLRKVRTIKCCVTIISPDLRFELVQREYVHFGHVQPTLD